MDNQQSLRPETQNRTFRDSVQPSQSPRDAIFYGADNRPEFAIQAQLVEAIRHAHAPAPHPAGHPAEVMQLAHHRPPNPYNHLADSFKQTAHHILSDKVIADIIDYKLPTPQEAEEEEDEEENDPGLSRTAITARALRPLEELTLHQLIDATTGSTLKVDVTFILNYSKAELTDDCVDKEGTKKPIIWYTDRLASETGFQELTEGDTLRKLDPYTFDQSLPPTEQTAADAADGAQPGIDVHPAEEAPTEDPRPREAFAPHSPQISKIKMLSPPASYLTENMLAQKPSSENVEDFDRIYHDYYAIQAGKQLDETRINLIHPLVKQLLESLSEWNAGNLFIGPRSETRIEAGEKYDVDIDFIDLDENQKKDPFFHQQLFLARSIMSNYKKAVDPNFLVQKDALFLEMKKQLKTYYTLLSQLPRTEPVEENKDDYLRPQIQDTKQAEQALTFQIPGALPAATGRVLTTAQIENIVNLRIRLLSPEKTQGEKTSPNPPENITTERTVDQNQLKKTILNRMKTERHDDLMNIFPLDETKYLTRGALENIAIVHALKNAEEIQPPNDNFADTHKLAQYLITAKTNQLTETGQQIVDSFQKLQTYCKDQKSILDTSITDVKDTNILQNVGPFTVLASHMDQLSNEMGIYTAYLAKWNNQVIDANHYISKLPATTGAEAPPELQQFHHALDSLRAVCKGPIPGCGDMSPEQWLDLAMGIKAEWVQLDACIRLIRFLPKRQQQLTEQEKALVAIVTPLLSEEEAGLAFSGEEVNKEKIDKIKCAHSELVKQLKNMQAIWKKQEEIQEEIKRIQSAADDDTEPDGDETNDSFLEQFKDFPPLPEPPASSDGSDIDAATAQIDDLQKQQQQLTQQEKAQVAIITPSLSGEEAGLAFNGEQVNKREIGNIKRTHSKLVKQLQSMQAIWEEQGWIDQEKNSMKSETDALADRLSMLFDKVLTKTAAAPVSGAAAAIPPPEPDAADESVSKKPEREGV